MFKFVGCVSASAAGQKIVKKFLQKCSQLISITISSQKYFFRSIEFLSIPTEHVNTQRQPYLFQEHLQNLNLQKIVINTIHFHSIFPINCSNFYYLYFETNVCNTGRAVTIAGASSEMHQIPLARGRRFVSFECKKQEFKSIMRRN